MNKKFIYSMFAVALLLTSCDYNEKHFPGYDEYTTPTDVQNDTITLLDADYKSISELKANQDIALSKDPEGKTYVDALDAVASNHFFTNDAQAVWYLPAYLDDTYPYLSDGSKITVNYNNYEDLPAYLTQLINANSYTLTPSDYRTVWGESISATFLSPSTIRQIPNILKEKISNPADGAVQAVSYVYSETEPSTGGGSEIPMVYKQVSDFNTEEGGVYVIAAQGKDGQYYPFGGELHAGDYGYMNPDPITVTDGIISSDDGNIYAITVATTANGYSLLNSRGQYLHMTGTHSTFDVANEFPSEGSDWSFNKNGNGTYSIVNIEKNKTIKLTIDEKYGYQYGSYPNYTFGSYYSGVTSNEDDGNLEAKDVTLPSGSTYVWKMDKEHGYWKGSSYVGGLSGAFIPVSEDHAMIEAAKIGALTLEKLEAMTCVCSVGLDMIAIPGDTSAYTISGIIADESAIGMVNNKTTAVRIIPVIGKGVGEMVEFGGLLGYAPIMAVNKFKCDDFIKRGGRIPAPIHSFKN